MRAVAIARLAVVAGAVSVLVAAPAAGEDVFRGSDGWKTGPSTSRVVIPADFFGPGSDPVSSIDLMGDPVVNGIDTIIERRDDVALAGCPSDGTTAIEIVALSLQGTVTVTYNGGQDPEAWDVRVCLSDCHVDPGACPQLSPGELVGSMTISQECTGGGTFTSTLPVLPKYIFTPVVGGSDMVLDLGLEGQHPEELVPPEPVKWTHSSAGGPAVPAGHPVDSNCDGVDDGDTLGSSNFVSGVGLARCTCNPSDSTQECITLTPEEALFLSHGVLPGGTDVVGCCLPPGFCKELTMQECLTQGGSDVVMVSPGKCGTVGACCFPDGTCREMAPGCCECMGGDPLGPQTRCLGDLNSDGTDDACQEFIPTVSEWGLVVLTLFLLAGAKIYFGRRSAKSVA